MKVVDYRATDDGGEKPSTLRRLKSGLGSLQSKPGSKAQETSIETLKKVLDNRFILLRDIEIAGIEPPAPLILVGPPGIWLIEASPLKGVYRAVDDQWEEMDNQTQKFRPARINLPAQTVSSAHEVASLLVQRGLVVPSVEPVIFFTEPGAHVEAVRSPARLVQSDAILRFAASLLQGQIIFSTEDVQTIIEAMREPASAHPTEQAEPELGSLYPTENSAQTSPAKKDLLPAQISAALNTDEPEVIKRLSRRASFTRRQWLILGGLLIVNILVFIAIIIVVLIIT